MCLKPYCIGAATRVALTQHHALRGNLADVTSKDSSQETCVNLLASFLSIYLLGLIEHSGYYFYSITILMFKYNNANCYFYFISDFFIVYLSQFF